LRVLRKQGWSKPIIGETTLTGFLTLECTCLTAN
jgi:hypothetical protein